MSPAAYLLLAGLALPLIGAILVMFVPREEKDLARGIGLGVAARTFVVSLGILGPFDGRIASFQLVFDKEWIPLLGTHFKIGVDGISIWLVLLTTFLTPVVLLSSHRVAKSIQDAEVTVPAAVTLATDVFDRFLDDNDLRGFALHDANDDAAIERRFLAARFPQDVREDLAAFLAEVDYPLAMRSSSLLEDSQQQSFTGVYETFMLGNERHGRPSNPEFLLRPGELLEAFGALAVAGFEQGLVERPKKAVVQRICAVRGAAGSVRIAA
jgi:hypothetical protein